jgi:hypothetical protein
LFRLGFLYQAIESVKTPDGVTWQPTARLGAIGSQEKREIEEEEEGVQKKHFTILPVC